MSGGGGREARQRHGNGKRCRSLAASCLASITIWGSIRLFTLRTNLNAASGMPDNLYLRESAARAAQPVPRTQFRSYSCPCPCLRLAAGGRLWAWPWVTWGVDFVCVAGN